MERILYIEDMKPPIYFILSVICFVPSGLFSADERRSRENPEDPSVYTFERRLIFYAVLEGLYEDGVAGEALDLIIPDERGMWVKDEPDKTNFVYSCPVCTHAFEALRLYKVRTPFYGQKATRYTTFGPGLDEEVVKRLQGTPQERRDAIQKLIKKWVARRLDMMALSEQDRKRIETNLEELKKKGTAALKRFQDGQHGDAFSSQYTDWERCAACEGAAAAAKVE